MLDKLGFTACITGIVFFYYSVPPPPTFFLTAFAIGVLWIPFLAILVFIWPSQAMLIRSSSGDWEPKGLGMAHAFMVLSAAFCLSRDMDLAAEVTKDLATNYEIYLAPDTGFSFVDTAMMCAASVLALELGKKASLWLVPVLQRYGLLEWNAESMEQMEETERRLDQ